VSATDTLLRSAKSCPQIAEMPIQRAHFISWVHLTFVGSIRSHCERGFGHRREVHPVSYKREISVAWRWEIQYYSYIMSGHDQTEAIACPGAETAFLEGDLDDLLSREWLITNGLGGYASSTVINCHTRRYHGLLVSAAIPPVGRAVMVNNMLERLVIDGREVQLSSFEFNGAVYPDGYRYQTSFHRHIEEDLQSVSFVFQVDNVTIIRTVWLFEGHNTALIYWLAIDGGGTRPLRFYAHPLIAMRDFHSLRRQSAGNVFDTRQLGQSLHIEVSTFAAHQLGVSHHLYLHPTGLRGPADSYFHAMPDWWYDFRYRTEAQRGQDCGEDLYMPGFYELSGRGRIGFGLWIDADGMDSKSLDKLLSRVNYHLQSGQGPLTVIDEVSSPLGPGSLSDAENPLREPPETTLRKAASQFVVRRKTDKGKSAWTILAGYHWFGDWGRDAFLSLPGLLLATGRYEQARDVLRVFGSAQADGLIPNRFDDYGGEPAYNSADASLWYIYAADEYLRATNDHDSWKKFLQQVCRNVVEAYLAGTRFDIKADEEDGLLWAGSEQTQITWMDARCGDEVFTPRWGKPVEVNALWYNALMTMSDRLGDTKKRISKRYRDLANKVAASFQEKFWNAQGRYLYDCIRDDFCDGSIRPNQIFAVSLRESPLRVDQQRAVVECVRRHLLTEYGLRTLAPSDPAYRGVYCGDQYLRDSAYHQGTVWAFLIGPFIEAYLKINNYSVASATVAQEYLKPLLDHLCQAGVGSISEIFDGDQPHPARGCIAQAWSVAEVIQARLLINRCLEDQITPAPTPQDTVS